MQVFLSLIAFLMGKHGASSEATKQLFTDDRGVYNNQVIRKSNKNHINNYIKEIPKEKEIAYAIS